MPTRSAVRLPLALLLASAAAPSFASTSAAWDEFRRDVESACRTAVSETMTDPQVVVDPFGLESYGLAFLSGVSSEDGTPQSLVCVYDKRARTVEIGGTMALENAVPTLRPDLEATAGTASEAGAGMPGPAETGLPASVSERLLSPSALAAPADVAALDAPAAAAPSDAANPPLFAGLCDAACSVTLEALSVADRTELIDLTNQIDRTIAANAQASLGAGALAARDAAAAAAASTKGEEGELTRPGEELVGSASCTLYYFGYQGEASRTVGTHQCRVSEEEDGTLLVEKTSGERLRAEIEPLVDTVSAFVGRTFEAGQEGQDYDPENPDDAGSDEFGNTVGFAAEADGQLMLISSQRRRFESSDSFFWVLAMQAP